MWPSTGGLVAGLERARELGLERLEIRLDSELIVRQVKGEYRVKNAGLKPLFERAQSLLREFRGWDIGHVPRAENKQADALANEALDRTG